MVLEGEVDEMTSRINVGGEWWPRVQPWCIAGTTHVSIMARFISYLSFLLYPLLPDNCPHHSTESACSNHHSFLEVQNKYVIPLEARVNESLCNAKVQAPPEQTCNTLSSEKLKWPENFGAYLWENPTRLEFDFSPSTSLPMFLVTICPCILSSLYYRPLWPQIRPLQSSRGLATHLLRLSNFPETIFCLLG